MDTNKSNTRLIQIILFLIFTTNLSSTSIFSEHSIVKQNLNRHEFKHKQKPPPIPAQTKQYINVVNYNARTSKLDHDTPNNWEQRKQKYFQVLQCENEANKLMETIQVNVKRSITYHLPHEVKSQKHELHQDCLTCQFSNKEPYPILETKYYRIALKSGYYDHIGATKTMVDTEVNTIKSIAQNLPWFSSGERFYTSHEGKELYQYFLNSIDCHDVRDASLMGHYGEAGSWGGFENDQFASKVTDGDFDCDTLDVTFTNTKDSTVLLTYSIHGAYDPKTEQLYTIDQPIENDYRLASDHFMIGFYLLLD